MPAAVSADRFLDALRQSGLLAAEQLDAQVRRSAAEGPPEDARELAARFVRDGLLTPYQADQLLLGRWQSLLIAGKYAVLAPLGVGGMGQVFLAEHVVMRRRSAIKVLPARLTADPAAVERFCREARAIAALDHPNIVRAYDIDNADDLHFLVMEYVDGVSLQDLVGRLGPVEPAAAANYIAQAARGLQHAHEAGWVHRDVKPANLLLDRSGTVKVLDLGLARLLADNAEPLTGRLDALGTADYLAPEQGIDSHAVDIRADIYSLGATFYFLLAGKPPFNEGTPAQRVLWHQTRAPRPIRELRPDVPAGLAAVLERMLAKAPTDRYAEPAVVAAALDPWAGGGVTYLPPADLAPTGSGGARSGVLSSWARHAGLSGTKGTPLPGRRPAVVPPIAAETDLPGATGRVATAAPAVQSKSRPWHTLLRRWPVVAGGLAAVALVVAGAIAFWPKPTPIGAIGDQVPLAQPELVGEVRQFHGHTDSIENLAFTPDGKRLVTVSQDKTARVWDVASGRETVRFTGHTEPIRGLAVLPDNRRAATAGWGGMVRLWDLDSGAELQRYVGHVGEVWSVACDAAGQRLITAGQDRSVRVWDVETGTQQQKLTESASLVTAALFLPDGRRAVSAGEDGVVRLWDLRTEKVVNRFRAPKMIYRLSLCQNGRRVLFGCDRELFRWDPDATAHRTTIPSEDPVEGGVALPDGRVVLAMLDGTVRVWEVNPARERHVFPGAGQAVLAVAVSPDGQFAASGGRDKTARLWRLPENQK
jgi:WD40 repeat protein/tRNA A-37 threonylcarbamoyl transferase component Bud32